MILRKKSAEGLTQIELRRLKRKRRKTRKKILLSIMLMLMICIGILFTPVFNLHEIELRGNEKVMDEELIRAGKFIIGENIFKFKLNEAGEGVLKIPYVNSVFIERKLPDKIIIEITESIPVAYIECNGNFVIVDKDGKVLEEKTDLVSYKIPVLSDFVVEDFSMGGKISVEDKENLIKTLEITKNLYNNNLIDKVESITLEESDYYLKMKTDLKVILGDTENLSGKLVMLNEVLLKLPQNATGIIDARSADKVYHRS